MNGAKVSIKAIRADIERSTFRPDLVANIVGESIDNDSMLAYLVSNHSPGHVTVLVLSSIRILIVTISDQPDGRPEIRAQTETLPLGSIRSVVVTAIMSERDGNPQRLAASEAAVSIGWYGSAGQKTDAMADGTQNDLVLRMNERTHGPAAVAQLLSFGRCASEATARLTR